MKTGETQINTERSKSQDRNTKYCKYSQSTTAPTAPETKKPKRHRQDKVADARKHDSNNETVRPEKQWSRLNADARKHSNQNMRKDTAKPRSTNHRPVRTESVRRKDTAESSMREDTAVEKNCDNNFDNLRHGREREGKMSYNQLNCYYTNLQSIMNKRAELQATIDEIKPEIIGITESWCNKTIVDAEIAIEGYSMFRLDKDTPTGVGGGIILYVLDSLTAVA